MNARRCVTLLRAAAPLGLVAARRALPQVIFCSTLTVAAAQSTDPHHPTVLGPHINRANITNDVKGHYYTFVAGPGHVDVELAFKEMGLFGGPFRQHINFDFWRPDGTLASHREVESKGTIARQHVSADLPTRQRFNLAVSTQWGAIKVGGYYEVELKGAVEPAASVGDGTKPNDSLPLVKP